MSRNGGFAERSCDVYIFTGDTVCGKIGTACDIAAGDAAASVKAADDHGVSAPIHAA